MNTLQLVCKASGRKIGNIRTIFVVKGAGVFRKPESALKAAAGTLRIIRVIIIGREYYGEFFRNKKNTRMEIKNYPCLKRNEFAKDFGIKNFRWR